jgi:hypothetical protein
MGKEAPFVTNGGLRVMNHVCTQILRNTTLSETIRVNTNTLGNAFGVKYIIQDGYKPSQAGVTQVCKNIQFALWQLAIEIQTHPT